MAGKVAMTYATIQQVASGFQQQGQALSTISKVLEAQIEILRMAAMFGAVMAKFLADYLEGIKNAIDQLVKDCEFYTKNLTKAVNDHKTGQYESGAYFTQGDSLGG